MHHWINDHLKSTCSNAMVKFLPGPLKILHYELSVYSLRIVIVIGNLYARAKATTVAKFYINFFAKPVKGISREVNATSDSDFLEIFLHELTKYRIKHEFTTYRLKVITIYRMNKVMRIVQWTK